MAATVHWLLNQLVAGGVEWWTYYNDALAKLEAGRTFTLAAFGGTLTKYQACQLDSSGRAILCTDSKSFKGVWQSTSTAAGATGQLQVDGYMYNAGWTWTPGSLVYATAAGALTQTKPNQGAKAVGVALAATYLILFPYGDLDTEGDLDNHALVNTTNASATTLLSKTLAAGEAWYIEARVVAVQGSAHRASYVRRALVYRRSTGGAAIQGSVSAEWSEESDPAWDCTIDVSGNDVRVRVTGSVGDTVNWAGRIEAVKTVATTAGATTTSTTTTTTTSSSTTTTTTVP